MKDVIIETIESFFSKKRNYSSFYVIRRYLKMKYRIYVSKSVLLSRFKSYKKS